MTDQEAINRIAIEIMGCIPDEDQWDDPQGRIEFDFFDPKENPADAMMLLEGLAKKVDGVELAYIHGWFCWLNPENRSACRRADTPEAAIFEAAKRLVEERGLEAGGEC